MLRAIVAVAVVGLGLTAGRPAWSDTPDPSGELVEFLIEQNEAARNAIKSASFEIAYEYRNPASREGPRHSIGHGTFFYKGDWRAADVSADQQFGDGREEMREIRAVLNDDYAATWRVGMGTAHQRDHESIENRTKEAKDSFDTNLWPHPLRYGFGEGYYTLAERWENADRRGEVWQVSLKKPQQAANELYYIEVYRGQEKAVPSHTFVLDPEKGYLVTQTFSYGADGQVGSVTDVKVEFDQASDVWFPARMVERSHPNWPMKGWASLDESIASVRPSLSMEVSNFQANQPIEDDRFAIDALGLEGRVFIIRRQIDDEREIYVHRDGQILPKAVEEVVRHGEHALEIIGDEELLAVDNGQTADANPSASEGALPATSRPESPPVNPTIAPGISVGWLLVIGGVACLAILAIITFRANRKSQHP